MALRGMGGAWGYDGDEGQAKTDNANVEGGELGKDAREEQLPTVLQGETAADKSVVHVGAHAEPGELQAGQQLGRTQANGQGKKKEDT